MKRAKIRLMHGADCHRWELTGHARMSGPGAEVRLSVTERETDGSLVVEIERFYGKVTVLAPGGVHLDLHPVPPRKPSPKDVERGDIVRLRDASDEVVGWAMQHVSSGKLPKDVTLDAFLDHGTYHPSDNHVRLTFGGVSNKWPVES